jgi:hypothetical protein
MPKIATFIQENRRYIAISILICLTVTTAWVAVYHPQFGWNAYWEARDRAKEAAQEYSDELANYSFTVFERPLKALELSNSSRIQSFGAFVAFVRLEDINKVYLDASERCFYSTNDRQTVRFYYASSNFDSGGAWTLSLTSFFVLLLLTFYVAFAKDHARHAFCGLISQKHFLKTAIFVLLTITAFVGIWLAVRTIALYIYQYLFSEGFLYRPSDISTIIGSVVAANLSLTLINALKESDGCPKTASGNDDVGLNTLKGIVDVLAQSVIIGLITFIPQYTQEETFSRIGGFVGYVTIVAVFVTSLVLLVFARVEFLSREKSEDTKS